MRFYARKIPRWLDSALLLAALTIATGIEVRDFLFKVTPSRFYGPLALIVIGTLAYLRNCIQSLDRDDVKTLSIVLFMGFSVTCMADVLLGYAYIFDVTGLQSNSPGAPPDRFDCLYFSAITWTTVGYGDLTPMRGASRFFAALEALNAYLYLGVFIAVLMNMLSKWKGGVRALATAAIPDPTPTIATRL